MQVSVFCFYILDTICSICSTVKQKYSASFVKSKEFSQKCLTNKAKTAILKIFTAMGLLVYHEKGFDGKKRERILHCRESAAGVSRQQGVQDNWSPSRRRNRRALSRISRLCRILSVSRVHIVRCDEWTHTLRQKEWYHGDYGLRLFCTDENICMEGAFFVDRADRRRSHDRVDHLHTTGKECIL
mgnify:FL=1